jgi:hypothetical protein
MIHSTGTRLAPSLPLKRDFIWVLVNTSDITSLSSFHLLYFRISNKRFNDSKLVRLLSHFKLVIFNFILNL